MKVSPPGLSLFILVWLFCNHFPWFNFSVLRWSMYSRKKVNCFRYLLLLLCRLSESEHICQQTYLFTFRYKSFISSSFFMLSLIVSLGFSLSLALEFMSKFFIETAAAHSRIIRHQLPDSSCSPTQLETYSYELTLSLRFSNLNLHSQRKWTTLPKRHSLRSCL